MLRRFICWWHGHRIKAHIIVMPTAGTLRYQFYCDRCNKPLPGPEPG